jgi:thiamine-monophosphate kinase
MTIKTAEHRLIENIRHWTGTRFIGDDCAVLPGQLLATCDTLVEGTHFSLASTSLEDLGWKCISVNLSDVAAMAGRPRYLLVAITIPEHVSMADVRRLYTGMQECARLFRSQIVGGDTTAGPVLSVCVTALAEVHEKGCLRRSGAVAEDVIVVSGSWGASAAGLWALQNHRPDFQWCIEAHRRPQPRLCESWALVRATGGRGSLMDASDGLADALVQISRESGCGMSVELDQIPIHSQTREAAAAAGISINQWALYGGEDYELVGSLPLPAWKSILDSPYNPFRAIGKVTAEPGVQLRNEAGEILPVDLSKSFQHMTI